MTPEQIPLFSFVGPEGSGKSTQAKLLAEMLGLPYVSTGEMLREAAENDTTPFGDARRKMFNEDVYLSPYLILLRL
jgi:adenylate kinase